MPSAFEGFGAPPPRPDTRNAAPAVRAVPVKTLPAPSIGTTAATKPHEKKSAFSSFVSGVANFAAEIVLAPLRALATPFAMTYQGAKGAITGKNQEQVVLPVLGDVGVSYDRRKAAGQLLGRSLDIGLTLVGGGAAEAAGKEAVEQGFKSAAKSAFRGFVKNAPRDAAIGAGYGAAAGLAEGDDAEGILKSAAAGSLVGLLLPPVAGTAIGAGFKATRGLAKYAGGAVEKAAARLEGAAETGAAKGPEELRGTFFAGVTVNEAEKTFGQRSAETGAKALRGAQKFADRSREWFVDKFTPVTRLQRKIEEAGLDPGDLTETVQAAEYRGLGRAENKLDEYNALRLSYGEDWANVKRLSLALDHLDRIAAGDVVQDNLTAEKIRADLRALAGYLGPERLALVQEGQRKLQKFLDGQLLDAVEYGRITAEQYQAIKKVHPNYIPHRLIDAMDENAADVRAGGSMQLTTSGIERTEGGTGQKIDDVDKSIVRLLLKQNRLNEVNRANQIVFDALGTNPEDFGFKPLRTAEKVKEREKYAAALSDIRTGIAAKLKKLRGAEKVDRTLVDRLQTLDRSVEEAEAKFYADLTATGVGGDDEELIRLQVSRERDKKARAEFVKDFTFSDGATEGAYQRFRDLAKRRPWLLDADVEQIRARLRKAGMKADDVDALFFGSQYATDADALDAFRGRIAAEKSVPRPDLEFLRQVDRIDRAVAEGEQKLSELVGERSALSGDRRAMVGAISVLQRHFDDLKGFEADLLSDMKNYLDVKVRAKDAKKAGMETYKFFRDGIREEWLVPEDVGRALKALDSQEAGMFMKVMDATLGNLAKFKRGIATQWNPMFNVVANPARDVQTAQVTSGLALTMADFAEGRQIAKSAEKGVNADDLLKLAREAGALQGGIMREGSQPEKILAAKARAAGLDAGEVNSRVLAPLSTALDWVQAAGQLNEESVRLAVFKRALDSGMAPDQAAKAARQSTVDFGRAGSFVRIANRYVPFLNARVQGAANLLTALDKDPVGVVRKLMTTALWPTVGLTAWNTTFSSYRNVPDDVKNKYWVVMVNQTDGVDNGQKIQVPYYIKIPKGEAQQAVSAIAERFLTLAEQKYPETTGEFYANLLGNLSPVTESSIFPAGIQEGVELWTNYSLFREKQIVPDYVFVNGKWLKSDEVAPRYRGQDANSHLAKVMGELLNWSPAKIDYVVKQGLVGDLLRGSDQVIDAAAGESKLAGRPGFEQAAELPWVRSILGDAAYGEQLRKKEAEKNAAIERNQRMIEAR